MKQTIVIPVSSHSHSNEVFGIAAQQFDDGMFVYARPAWMGLESWEQQRLSWWNIDNHGQSPEFVPVATQRNL